MFSYILQIIAFQLLFLLVYEVLLKKETFFNWNRWYLLLTAIVSLLLPVIRIEALSTFVAAEAFNGLSTVWLPEVILGSETTSQNPAASEVNSRSISINPWLMVYAVGVAGSFLLFLKKYRNLSRLFRNRTVASEKDFRIIEIPDSSIACTFYRTVFLGDKLSEAEKQHILSHELVHVRQKHSLDLLFFEVYKILFWFNPLVYIYQSKIASLHEYIADAAVVRTSEKQSYYQQLLNSAFNTTNISFINQFFNHSLIKKRIVMLQKSKSKTIAKFKYLLLVPLMLVMLTYVACSDDAASEVETTSEISDTDAAMKTAFWEEIQQMEESGANGNEIAAAFFTPGDDLKSKEEFYRFNTLMRYMHEKSIERSKAEGTYDEEKEKKFAENYMNRTYEDYVASRANRVQSENKSSIKKEFATGDEIPFAVIEQVPVFPGCEDLASNEGQKKCMSVKIQEFVVGEFDTGLGKKLGLKGVNRVIVQFKIDKNGNVTDVRSRAPHPDLEVEAERVINSLPQMKPGQQDGQPVGVMYSLPIVFQVSE